MARVRHKKKTPQGGRGKGNTGPKPLERYRHIRGVNPNRDSRDPKHIPKSEPQWRGRKPRR